MTVAAPDFSVRDSLILHIPHSSKRIPRKYRSLFFLSDEELEQELIRMTDVCVDDLFAPHAPAENSVIFPISRLFCDPERFRDDSEEIMAARGMGVCYSVTSQLAPLKKITPEYRTAELRCYDRHHSRLAVLTDDVLEACGACLIVDCHSFSSFRLPYEDPDTGSRAQVCIGTDSFHTPPWLGETTAKAFMDKGYSIAFNAPFSGTLVPMKHYGKDRRVLSVMIELNRSLYLDERTGLPGPGFERLRQDLGDVLALLRRDHKNNP